MWSLIKKLMVIVQQFGISFDDLITVIKTLLSLPRPPAIQDEVNFRKWVCTVLHTLVGLAEQTPTEIDDNILKMVDDAVENDTVWPMIYKLLMLVFNRDSNIRKMAAVYYGDGTDFAATGAELALATDIVAACDRGVGSMEEIVERVEGTYEGFDPATVVMIASALYELYKYLERKFGGVVEAGPEPRPVPQAPADADDIEEGE